MDNLNKKNTWDELEFRSPKAYQYFKDWIISYLIENNWDELFNDGVVYKQSGIDRMLMTISPNFYEIPYELQIGVILFFFKSENLLDNTAFALLFDQKSFTDWLRIAFDQLESNLLYLEKPDKDKIQK